ncbi:F-box/RNI-like/FBD-like domains-containing protein [Rhynchospora pubera]|uniref:F-box/RNI-like/FBD-like domains-containing protein n=1 Tax=Rhynchospora pubera TaxID=906938 RepID=A0AAV8EZQ5_9POAL|nr:F-box/RNI-like/FBD-like domains-containing protein [Rhynchospora pubera]
MATTPIPIDSQSQLPDPNANEIDHLSALPDALLLTILSLLPLRVAARTSFLSRRFRHLWRARPSLELISRDLPPPKCDNVVAMADSALLRRDPSHLLLSLLLDISGYAGFKDSFFSSLLLKAQSLLLRHLTIGESCSSWDLLHSLHIIFSIHSLQSLSLPTLRPSVSSLQAFQFPSSITLTCLKSLSLSLVDINPAEINRLLSQLPSLEDLHLQIRVTDPMLLSSQSIRKLELIVVVGCENFDTLELSMPLLEFLCFETHGLSINKSLPHVHGAIPSLRKAVIKLDELHKKDASAAAGLLKCISQAEELSLHLKESEDEMVPFTILLEPGKDPPNFPNLKSLDVTMCCHKHNFEAVVAVLHHCPALESLKLVHEFPKFTYRSRLRNWEDWVSELPCSGCHYVYFRNLHLGENVKEFEYIKSLNNKYTSKRQASS